MHVRNSSSFLAPKIFNKVKSKMKSQSVVSMTGFVRDVQEEKYKNMISELKLRLASTLSQETEVLVVNDVTTEKYKIARTYDPPIACVTIEWLTESHKKNKKLPVDNYHVKKLFYGAHVKVLDFDSEKSKRLESKLVEQGAFVRILKNNTELGELLARDERMSVVITTSENFARLKHFMEQITFPVVGVEWLEDSLRSKMCKYPYDYALNQFYICSRAPHQHGKKMRNKLETYLTRDPPFKDQNLIMEDTIVYVAENVNQDLARVLKKLILVLGGFYVEVPSPVVTHILTEPVTETECGELTVFGALVFLVRVQWLIDSIYLSKRMKEEDYFIRSYKPRSSHSIALEDNTNQQNSTSFNTFGASLALLPRKSISLPTPVPIKTKAAKKFVSTIFKDCKFYIQSSQKKEVELLQLPTKIRNHGGVVFDSRAHIQHGLCYYVLKDNPECTKAIEQLKSDTKGRVQIQPVSYRWLNDCLAKGHFIDPVRAGSYVYKPFNFKTPIMGFHKMVFDVLGLDDVARLRLKELYNNLGSVKNTPNRAEITHCLCGEKYRESQRYKDIKRQNHTPKFIEWKWLIDCVNAGRIIDTEKYLLEKEGDSSQENTENPTLQILPEVTV